MSEELEEAHEHDLTHVASHPTGREVYGCTIEDCPYAEYRTSLAKPICYVCYGSWLDESGETPHFGECQLPDQCGCDCPEEKKHGKQRNTRKVGKYHTDNQTPRARARCPNQTIKGVDLSE